MAKKTNLLIVEDDVGIQNQLKWSLDEYNVTVAGDHASAIAALRLSEPVVILLDLGLPPDPGGASEGLRVLEEVQTLSPSTKVIVITGNDDRTKAVEAVGLGAYDLYQKPIAAAELNHVVSRAINLYQLELENAKLQRISGESSLTGVITVGGPMERVCRDIEKIAPSNIATLLLGESGTGKELLAKALHELSPRSENQLVAINCAAIPENLLESELFGYEKGAFTGASKQTKGKLEYADGGTLFLDEIGDLPLGLQAKLLRFLQEKKIERVGGRSEIAVDARVISATHRNLQELISQQQFREDLFYRLGEVTVEIPPLRDRQGDILTLAKFFLHKFSEEYGKSVKRFDNEALSAIASFKWPGNIRELENRVKRATVMCESKAISVSDLGLDRDDQYEIALNLQQVRNRAERGAVINALRHADGNMSKAAVLLGVSRPTLYDLANRLEIDTNEVNPPNKAS